MKYVMVEVDVPVNWNSNGWRLCVDRHNFVAYYSGRNEVSVCVGNYREGGGIFTGSPEKFLKELDRNKFDNRNCNYEFWIAVLNKARELLSDPQDVDATNEASDGEIVFGSKYAEKHCIHLLIKRAKMVSVGTAETWIEPFVLADDDGNPLSFASESDAHEFVRSDELYNHTYGLTVVGYEIREFYSLD